LKTGDVLGYGVVDNEGWPINDTYPFLMSRKDAREVKNTNNLLNHFCAPYRIVKVVVEK